MSQTSYSINLVPASYPGQPADDGFKDITSALAAAAAIGYGLLAVVDTTNSGGMDNLACKVPAASTDITVATKVVGVVVADQARAQSGLFSVPTYPRYAAVPCAKKGRFWVLSETAVADGAPVYARWQTGDNGTIPGSLGGTLDTTTVGNALLLNAVWRGKTTAAGYAVVELNIV